MKYPLAEALAVAQDILEKMSDLCERCEIAGSIRRQKAEVKDIEIVAIPKWIYRPDPSDLFGETTVGINRLWLQLDHRIDVVWIKPGTRELIPWKIKQEGKYWRGLLANDMVLDLFLVEPDNWGIQLAIRTGDAEFSQALVTHAKRQGMPCAGGYLTDEGQRIITPEEKDVFDILGLEYVEPKDRSGWRLSPAREP